MKRGRGRRRERERLCRFLIGDLPKEIETSINVACPGSFNLAFAARMCACKCACVCVSVCAGRRSKKQAGEHCRKYAKHAYIASHMC